MFYKQFLHTQWHAKVSNNTPHIANKLNYSCQHNKQTAAILFSNTDKLPECVRVANCGGPAMLSYLCDQHLKL